MTFAVAFSRFTTISAVIIFVSDAIGSTRSGSRRQRTAPVSRSKSRPLRGWSWKRTRSGSAVASSLSRSGGGAGAAGWDGPVGVWGGGGGGWAGAWGGWGGCGGGGGGVGGGAGAGVPAARAPAAPGGEGEG